MHKNEIKPVTLEDGIIGYEKKDVEAGRLIVPFAILAMVTVACAMIALVCYRTWSKQPGSNDVAILSVMEQRALPPLPRIQESPVVDIQALHEQEDKRLNGYAWVDKQAGIVQIPVDRAMEIIAAKGLPHGREAHIPGKGQQPGAPAAAASSAPVPAAAPAPVAPAPAAAPAQPEPAAAPVPAEPAPAAASGTSAL